MNVVSVPSKITRLFAMAAVSLISLHLTTQSARFFLGISTNNLIFRFFPNEFHLEQNVSAFCSATALLFCPLVLFQKVETLDIGIVFICALTSHIASELSDVCLSLAPSRQELL